MRKIPVRMCLACSIKKGDHPSDEAEHCEGKEVAVVEGTPERSHATILTSETISPILSGGGASE